MIGLGELLLSYLRRQIGLRTDSDSPSGSVHAKLSDLRTYMTSILPNLQDSIERAPWMSGKNVNVAFGMDYTSRDTGGAWDNIFSLSGPVQVYDGYMQIANIDDDSYFEFTLDNHVDIWKGRDMRDRGYDVGRWFRNPNFSLGQRYFSWIIPRLYSNMHDGVDGYAAPPTTFLGTILSLPFMYVNSLLRLRFKTSAGNSREPNVWWGIYYSNV